jgi:hypothetical protein
VPRKRRLSWQNLLTGSQKVGAEDPVRVFISGYFCLLMGWEFPVESWSPGWVLSNFPVTLFWYYLSLNHGKKSLGWPYNQGVCGMDVCSVVLFRHPSQTQIYKSQAFSVPGPKYSSGAVGLS